MIRNKNANNTAMTSMRKFIDLSRRTRSKLREMESDRGRPKGDKWNDRFWVLSNLKNELFSQCKLKPS